MKIWVIYGSRNDTPTQASLSEYKQSRRYFINPFTFILMYDDNLPPGTTQEELEARDEELTDDEDTWLLDDDSDDFDSLEERLEPLLENLQ